jgi:hypothetical protein
MLQIFKVLIELILWPNTTKEMKKSKIKSGEMDLTTLTAMETTTPDKQLEIHSLIPKHPITEM